ncbi:hypothetical protein AJ88_16910 [Mesorhizobium amorphae CCBAU 01583]|nr:hypothetical protein AJ88_16910 [Mesorhizobium amorphae CCBAU 01583]
MKVSTGKPDPGFRLNGKFSLDHHRLSFDEFRFETGPLDNPYTATARLRSISGSIRASRSKPMARRCSSTRPWVPPAPG